MVACKSVREYNNNQEKIKQICFGKRGELSGNNSPRHKDRAHQRRKFQMETMNYIATNK